MTLFLDLFNMKKVKNFNVSLMKLLEDSNDGVIDLKDRQIGSINRSSTVLKNLLPKFFIRCLNLSGNSLSDHGLETLSVYLQTNDTIEELQLGRNNISSNGGIHLQNILSQNKSIKLLTLEMNSLGNIGASHIGKGIKTNDTVQILNLEGNQIEDEGVISLCEGLKANRSLKSLNLKMNKIGLDSIQHMDNCNLSLKFLSIQVRDKSIQDVLYAEYLVESLKFNVQQNYEFNEKLNHFPKLKEEKESIKNLNFKFRVHK
eukprot:gene22-4273_t